MADVGEHRTALVTGASAGIGREFARVFAEHGFDVVLVARRRERLVDLAEELRREHGVETRVLAADLADPAAPDQMFESLEREGVTVDALVNNAGYAIAESFSVSEWSRQRDLIQVMVTAVAHLCRLFAPGMAERGYGRIINVASLAVYSPPVAGCLYAGAKSFVVHLSRALAAELRHSNVHVTAVCPGFTYSEFHDVMGTRNQVDRLPSFMWMSARQVAEQSYDAVMLGKTVYINGRVNRALAALCGVLPTELIQRGIDRRSRRSRGQGRT